MSESIVVIAPTIILLVGVGLSVWLSRRNHEAK